MRHKKNNEELNFFKKIHINILGKIRFSGKLFLLYSLLINAAVLAVGLLFANFILTGVYHENLNAKQTEISREAAIINERLERVGLFADTVFSMRRLNYYITETVHEFTWSEIWQLRTNELATLNTIIHMYGIVDSVTIYAPNDHMRPIPPFILNISEMPAWSAKLFDPTQQELYFHLYGEAIIDNGIFDRLVFYFINRDLRGNMTWLLEVYLDIGRLFYNVLAADEHLFLIDGNFVIHSADSRYFLQQLAAQPEKFMAKADQFDLMAGDERIVIWAPLISSPNIQLIRLHYRTEINRQMASIRMMIIAGLVFLMAIFTGFITLITNTMFKRLNVVVNAMRRVEEGDIFFIAPSPVNDEISIMTDGFNRMMNNLLSHFSIGIRRQAAAKEAEIQSLLNQINSHFLYNVLDSFKCMAEINYNYELADAITALAQITRYNVDEVRKYTSINDEIRYINNYVMLVNIRKGNTIIYKSIIDPSILRCKVLKMITQPFVENALTHAFAGGRSSNVLLLKITRCDQDIDIIIADNGIGMDSKTLERLRKIMMDDSTERYIPQRRSVGILNTYARLKLEYGDAALVDIQSKQGFYTRVLISLKRIVK